MGESLPGKESFSSCWVKHVPGCENSSFRFPNSLIDVSAYYYYFTILTLRAFILSDSFKYQLHAEDRQISIFLKSRLHLAVPSASQHVPNRALSLSSKAIPFSTPPQTNPDGIHDFSLSLMFSTWSFSRCCQLFIQNIPRV